MALIIPEDLSPASECLYRRAEQEYGAPCTSASRTQRQSGSSQKIKFHVSLVYPANSGIMIQVGRIAQLVRALVSHTRGSGVRVPLRPLRQQIFICCFLFQMLLIPEALEIHKRLTSSPILKIGEL